MIIILKYRLETALLNQKIRGRNPTVGCLLQSWLKHFDVTSYLEIRLLPNKISTCATNLDNEVRD